MIWLLIAIAAFFCVSIYQTMEEAPRRPRGRKATPQSPAHAMSLRIFRTRTHPCGNGAASVHSLPLLKGILHAQV